MSQREVHIESFDQVRDEVKRLHQEGYTSLGTWNLAQVCYHLDCWMKFPMDGFPPIPFALRPLMWTMKKLIGRKMLLKVITEGKMKAGGPTMPATVIPSDKEEEAVAVERFQETLDRFTQFSGDVQPSPLFGAMTLEECRQLQLVHCRHHLGFLKVKE